MDNKSTTNIKFCERLLVFTKFLIIISSNCFETFKSTIFTVKKYIEDNSIFLVCVESSV